ncbi:hypothetical protein [Streptomyces sp. NPDC048639]|uniref:hypothetical protein n=1 Tax=Streptomyces sp. NPDC048639 TaxID=3365581 RepID=UPI00371DFA0E
MDLNHGTTPSGKRIVSAESIREMLRSRVPVPDPHMFGPVYLTLVLDPVQAQFLRKPDRIRYELLPVSETHFLMPPAHPLEDTQTVAIYDFTNGTSQYLHTNCRVNPRQG